MKRIIPILFLMCILVGCRSSVQFYVLDSDLPYQDKNIQAWADKNNANGIYLGKTVESGGVSVLYLYLNNLSPVNNEYKKYSPVSIGSTSDKSTIEISTTVNESKEKYGKIFKIIIEDSKVDNVILNGEKIMYSSIKTIE